MSVSYDHKRNFQEINIRKLKLRQEIKEGWEDVYYPVMIDCYRTETSVFPGDDSGTWFWFSGPKN